MFCTLTRRITLANTCPIIEVEAAFKRMIQNANVRYVVISYNSEGLLSKEQLSKICLKFAVKNSFQCKEILYRPYSNVGTKLRSVNELLFFFEKAQ